MKVLRYESMNPFYFRSYEWLVDVILMVAKLWRLFSQQSLKAAAFPAVAF